MKKTIGIALLCCLCSMSSIAADYTLASPDGKVRSVISVAQKTEVGIMYGGVSYLRIPCVAMETSQEVLGENVKVRNTVRHSVRRTVSPLYGINASIPESYNELQLDCKGNYSIVFRAYNEGIAWRFVIRKGKHLIVKDEKIDYQFKDNYTAYFHPLLSESDYRIQKVSDSGQKYNYSSMPVLVKTDDGVNILLHESGVMDYPCMSLKSDSSQPNTLTTGHARFPKMAEPGGYNNFNLVVKRTEDYIARTSGNRALPWRIVAFAAKDKDILNNQLVYLLAPETRLADTQWIKPGKVAWDWWNGLNISGVDFRSGFNTATYKYYIDFAARNGIEYVNLDEGWGDQFDLLKVRDSINMQELADYARSRGVGLFLWCVWHTLDRQMPQALAQFEKWGIAGLKVDFLDRDDQLVVDFEERLLKEAAKHKLLVNFHGAYHPNGMERAYPNCINVEGVKGLEWDKIAGTDGATPQTAVTIPFIRMFAGPMDYTPGAMSNYNQEEWRIIKERPMSQGTRCQQLAMYVVYYAPLQMLADSPTAYMKEPQFTKFLASIPTVWDKTLPLDSKVGEYVNIARKKGNTWYVAGMTNWMPRDQHIRFDFLDKGREYVAEIVRDGVNADKVGSDYVMEKKDVHAGDELNLRMMPGGGYTVRLTPKDEKHDIVVFGDSRVQMAGDWNLRMNRTDVTNAGFGGFTTSHFIWLVDPYVIQRHPRLCFLEGGCNDIGAGIPLERVKQNFRSLVDSLMAHGIEVVLNTVTYPTEKDPKEQNFKTEMMDSVNTFLFSLAREKGLPCIDLNPLLTEGKRLKKEYALDNVHYTPAAYAIWVREMEKILKAKGI